MYCVPWFVPSGAAILPVRNFHLNFVFAGTEVFLTIFVDLGRVIIAVIILGSPFAWCGGGGGVVWGRWDTRGGYCGCVCGCCLLGYSELLGLVSMGILNTTLFRFFYFYFYY